MNHLYERISEHLSICGEGPLWNNDLGMLHWIDIIKGEIISYSEIDKHLSIASVGQKIGAIGLIRGTNVLAALKDGIYKVSLQDTSKNKIHNLEAEKVNNRANDGKVDAMGRFWIGTMSDIGEQEQGSLFCIDNKGIVEAKLTGISISNGLDWDLKRNLFYHIDTPTKKVFVYIYEPISGAITNRQIAIDFEQEIGFPDGMCIDTEGMLWIAHWDGGRISRWDPKQGVKVAEYHLPVSKITSCTFGGNQLSDLFVTTARVGLSEVELKDEPLAGSTFVIRNTGCFGVPNNDFKL